MRDGSFIFFLLTLFLLAILIFIFFRSIRRHQNDREARYRQKLVILIIWAIFFAAIVEWTLDCSGVSGQNTHLPHNYARYPGNPGMEADETHGCPDFWLRDGDVIEVPERP